MTGAPTADFCNSAEEKGSPRMESVPPRILRLEETGYRICD